MSYLVREIFGNNETWMSRDGNFLESQKFREGNTNVEGRDLGIFYKKTFEIRLLVIGKQKNL